MQTALQSTKLSQAHQQRLENLGLSYLLEEILDVIENSGILTLEEYLVKERQGGLISLRTNIRKTIWAVYQTWQERMAKNGYTTWEQLRRKALEVATQLPEKPYQAVIIDEAQDLSPVSLRLLFALVPSFQRVYLTADASQSIYQRGFSWKQVHVDLQVRARNIVKRNHRNTQQIASACATILQGSDGLWFTVKTFIISRFPLSSSLAKAGIAMRTNNLNSKFLVPALRAVLRYRTLPF